MKMLAKETAVFLPIAVLWCFPLKWKEFSMRINLSISRRLYVAIGKLSLYKFLYALQTTRVIFAMTCDVHRSKKCSIFHLFFQNIIYKVGITSVILILVVSTMLRTN